MWAARGAGTLAGSHGSVAGERKLFEDREASQLSTFERNAVWEMRLLLQTLQIILGRGNVPGFEGSATVEVSDVMRWRYGRFPPTSTSN